MIYVQNLVFLDMYKELEKYGKSWCNANNKTFKKVIPPEEWRFYNLPPFWVGTPGFPVVPTQPFIVTNPRVSLLSDEVQGYDNKSAATQRKENRTDESVESELEFSVRYLDSQSNSTTHGVTAGASVTTSASFDILFVNVNVEVSYSLEYNFTNTQETRKEREVTWTDRTKISIPPHTLVTANYFIQDGAFNKTVILDCDVTGGGYIEVVPTDPNHRYEVWGWDVAEIMRGNAQFVGNHFKGSGSFAGSTGLDAYIQIQETPLPGYPGQTREYQIPVTGKTGLEIPIFDPIGSIQ